MKDNFFRYSISPREDGKFFFCIHEGVHIFYTFIFEEHELPIAEKVYKEDGFDFYFEDKVKAMSQMA